MTELLTYVLTVVLGLAFVWVAACIYLVIKYGDDGKRYIVYQFHIEDGTCSAVKEIGSVRFPTAYLILNTMPEITTASCDGDEKHKIVVVRTSEKEVLAVAFTGPLERALSRKYNIQNANNQH